MNRKVKFRGICKEEFHTHHEATEVGEFIYGYLVCPNKIRTAMSEEHGGVGPGIVHVDIEIDPKTVGECTGLKDKNGKDIYEGDILKITYGDFTTIEDESPWVVGDGNDGFCFHSDICYLRNVITYSDETAVEIIGNIYEDEDLLK